VILWKKLIQFFFWFASENTLLKGKFRRRLSPVFSTVTVTVHELKKTVLKWKKHTKNCTKLKMTNKTVLNKKKSKRKITKRTVFNKNHKKKLYYTWITNKKLYKVKKLRGKSQKKLFKVNTKSPQKCFKFFKQKSQKNCIK